MCIANKRGVMMAGLLRFWPFKVQWLNEENAGQPQKSEESDHIRHHGEEDRGGNGGVLAEAVEQEGNTRPKSAGTKQVDDEGRGNHPAYNRVVEPEASNQADNDGKDDAVDEPDEGLF